MGTGVEIQELLLNVCMLEIEEWKMSLNQSMKKTHVEILKKKSD